MYLRDIFKAKGVGCTECRIIKDFTEGTSLTADVLRQIRTIRHSVDDWEKQLRKFCTLSCIFVGRATGDELLQRITRRLEMEEGLEFLGINDPIIIPKPPDGIASFLIIPDDSGWLRWYDNEGDVRSLYFSWKNSLIGRLQKYQWKTTGDQALTLFETRNNIFLKN